ncbi:MAG TPA: diguanylate cyclase [Vicinamibacterales bacterium]|nr:diguanylate cyclase [Vicinamibacterales bacterium]
MDRLSLSARAFTAAVILTGTVTLAVCLPLARFEAPRLFVLLLLLSSATAVLKIPLPLETSSSTMSVSYAVDFAALMALGPHETMLVAAVSAFTQCQILTKTRTPLYRTLFSMAALILAVQGAGLVFNVLSDGGPARFMEFARPLAGAALTYFIINTGLVAGAIAFSTGARITDTWRENFLWSAPSYFIGAGTAELTMWAVSVGGYWVAPLTFAPIYLMYRTYRIYRLRIDYEERHAQQTSDLHLATIEALARAIDAKDQPTQAHISRVQQYAAELAKSAGLTADEIQGVKIAALLHDIGKLAVPEHVLSKPGPLTQEEFQKIRIHPQVGADIIAGVPFPYPVAPLILSHHERWDGRGYPQGLAGEEIPIGARILAIADYYDAVTTERPYHRALHREDAIPMLRHEAGRALDPRLVNLFVLLPALVGELSDESVPHADVGPAALETTDATGPPPAGTAFENIALAHREIYALYEIAKAMGTSLGVKDTMALISSKLSKLVPWSGCALFLLEPETEQLRCCYAAGVDAPRLLDKTLTVGQGLSGRVARSRRSIINGDPRVSFAAAGIPEPTVLNAALVCPLYFEDKFLGCLALYHTTPGYYAEDHRRLLERVGEQAGAVIHNSIVFEQTQEDSLTDPLTGLPNRRSMFVHLSRELSRAGRLRSDVALIVMDVDGFKAINDTYGHNVGDAALRAIAEALQRGLRPYDLCVRYAGDEFIIVLTGCSREMAEAKKRELQEQLAVIELVVRPGRFIRSTVSAGVAVYPHDGETYETLLAAADQRMYRDKAGRRGDMPIRRIQSPETSVADAVEVKDAPHDPVVLSEAS